MAVIKKLKAVKIEQNHLLGIQGLSHSQVNEILKQAKTFIALNKSSSKKIDILRGKHKSIFSLNHLLGHKAHLSLQENVWALML